MRVLYSLCNETLVYKLQEIAEKAYKLHASVACPVVGLIQQRLVADSFDVTSILQCIYTLHNSKPLL